MSAAGGSGIGRVIALLLVLLSLDLQRARDERDRAGVTGRADSTYEISEVILGSVRTEMAGDGLCHRVTAKEGGKGRQTETEIEVSAKDVEACMIVDR